jgi:hypothetical protein
MVAQANKEVEMVCFYAKQLGCQMSETYSKDSRSVYLKLETGGKVLRLRFSELPLPESYGVVEEYINFDVGTHARSYGNWCQCVAWLAREIGQPIPDEIQKILEYSTNKEKKIVSDILHARSEQMFQYILEKAVAVCKKKDKKLYAKYTELAAKLEKKNSSQGSLDKTRSHYRKLENKIIQSFASG